MRSSQFDIAKIILSIFVVYLHGLIIPSDYESINNVFANYLFRICVPLFFCISGFFAYHVFRQGKALKWFARIFVLYAFWMAVYSPFYLQEVIRKQSFFAYVTITVFGYYHLWYIAALFVFGGIFYFIRGKKLGRYLAMAIPLYIIGCSINYAFVYGVAKFLPEHYQTSFAIYRNGLFFGFPMGLIGAYLAQRREEARLPSIAIGWLITALGGMILFAEYQFNASNHVFRRMDMMFALPPITFGIICLLSHVKIDINTKKLAEISSVVFFVHIGFIQIFQNYQIELNVLMCTLIVAICLVLSPPLLLLNGVFVKRTGYSVL